MFSLRRGPSFWIGLSVLVLFGLLGAVSGGLGAAMWFISLAGFGTGLFGWIRKRRTLWFGTVTGDGIAALLIGSLVMGTAGIAFGAATSPTTPAIAVPSLSVSPTHPTTPSATETTIPTPTPTTTPTPADTPTPTPTPIPSASTEAPSAPATAAAPAPTTAAPPATTAAPPPPPAATAQVRQFVSGVVVNGQFCKKINTGWYGYTSKHVLEICKVLAAGETPHWQPA
jgi:hypothetical protein